MCHGAASTDRQVYQFSSPVRAVTLAGLLLGCHLSLGCGPKGAATEGCWCLVESVQQVLDVCAERPGNVCSGVDLVPGRGTIYNSGLSIERNKWSGAVTGPDGSPERPENVCSGVDSWCRGVGTTPALSIERNKWCCYGEDGGVTVR